MKDKKKPMTVSVPVSVHNAAQAHSKRTGVTISHMTSEAIREWLERAQVRTAVKKGA